MEVVRWRRACKTEEEQEDEEEQRKEEEWTCSPVYIETSPRKTGVFTDNSLGTG